MREGPLFLGVYAKAAELEQNGGKNATRWHVWGLPDGGFMLREAPAEDDSAPGGRKPVKQPGEPRRLSPDEFFLEYRVLSAFTPRKKNHPTPPEAPPVEDYTRGGKPGAAGQTMPAAGSPADRAPARAAVRESASGVAPEFSQSSARAGYGNLWARRDEAGAARPEEVAGDAARQEGAVGAPRQDGAVGAPRQAGATGAARRTPGEDNRVEYAWRPAPAEEQSSGVTLVKGSKEPKRPLTWDLPKRKADDESAAGGQASFVEILEEPGAPVVMPPEEIDRIEEDFRTGFSLALIRLKGRRDEAIASLEKMADSPGPFAVEHKYMFTDCGLALRKRNFYALANKFHERARELSPNDEHVLFNQARVMYESGRIDKARTFLQLALEMEPGFGEARDFLNFIDGPDKK